MTAVPNFTEPPVVEMALGAQFRPLFTLRGITLGPLRERWRDAYPHVEEQPPLPPAIEGGLVPGIGLQVGFGPMPNMRHWFLNEAGTELVQLQHDRLIVNWRQADTSSAYPRYDRMRTIFEQRLADLAGFVEQQGLGSIEIVQAEANYINAVGVQPEGRGHLGGVLRGWVGTPDHHLGEPEEARVALAFAVPDLGRPPVRMYVNVDPAQRGDGSPVLFMTLTVRGAPAGAGIADTLEFVDGAHEHLVQSFMELTAEPMHSAWGLRE